MAEATPCACCGTTGGYIQPRMVRPVRCSGAPYGFAGTLCNACRLRHDKRVNAARYAKTTAATIAATPPCACCKTTGGRIADDRTTPSRTSGEPFGFAGVLCHRCYGRHYKRLRAGNTTARRQGPKRTEFRADPLDPRHQGLVHAIARTFLGRGMDLDDLIGWGQVALLKACLGYERDSGAKFTTYATTCIRNTLIRELADKVSLVHIPNYLAGHVWKQGADMPTARKNTRLDEAREVLGRMVVGDHCLEEPLATLVYAREDDETEARDEEIERAKAQAATILATLPPAEATVLRLRFGIACHREHTLKEVGRVIGYSRETVRTIEHRAIERLRTQEAIAS
jgi:RNA polymerase sigma factor (sigma-70 family)